MPILGSLFETEVKSLACGHTEELGSEADCLAFRVTNHYTWPWNLVCISQFGPFQFVALSQEKSHLFKLLMIYCVEDYN